MLAQYHFATATTFADGDQQLASVGVNVFPLCKSQLALSRSSQQQQLDEQMQVRMRALLAGAQQLTDLTSR